MSVYIAASGRSRRQASSHSLLRQAVGILTGCIIVWCGITFMTGTIAISRVAYTRVQQAVLSSPLGRKHSHASFHSWFAPSLEDLAPLGLQRSLSATSLEEAMEGDINVGVCTLKKHMLPGMVEHDCANLYCMWSPKLSANIDFWFNAFHPFGHLHHAPLEPCHELRGGQIHHRHLKTQLAFVITVHNNARLASEVLLETFRAAGEVESAEIIVVDDGSTEDMGVLREACRRLTAFFGTRVQYLVNKKALGFGAANMRGVHASRAEYVMLLNSDAFLMKGAVYALLRTIQEVPDAGIVGPLFIGADHRVSEAGGILFSSGEAGNYGRGRRVRHDLNFRRPVDYLSAACAVFKREVFLELGGFDRMYGKGYFEDADLAMAIRKRGLQVVYQPLAVVLHLEGSTLGTDMAPQKQALMKANQKLFAAKWEKELQQHCPRALGYDLAAHRRSSPKVLWIDDIVPETDRDSGSLRTWHMLQVLVQYGYEVSFQPTASGRQPSYTQQARFAGVDVLPVQPASKWPLSVGSVCMYDVILVARRYVFDPVKDTVKKACPDVPIIYDTVDLHFLRESRDYLSASRPAKDPAHQDNMHADWDFSHLSMGAVLKWLDSKDPEAAAIQGKRDLELSLIDASSLIIVVSEVEVQAIHHYRPRANIQVISNIHHIDAQPLASPATPRPPSATSTCQGRTGIIFVGNLQHGPNRQAIQQLLGSILPRAKELLPPQLRQDFILHIVGSNLPPGDDGVQLRRLLNKAMKAGDVLFHGHLSEELLQLLYSSVKAVVAPLLSGAGVKGKVNQAMKYGVPVVATPIAVEGMHATEWTTCMIAKSPEEFAQKLVRVYGDCELWDTLVEGGHDNVRRYFSVEAARFKVLEAFQTLNVGPLTGGARERCDARVQLREG